MRRRTVPTSRNVCDVDIGSHIFSTIAASIKKKIIYKNKKIKEKQRSVNISFKLLVNFGITIFSTANGINRASGSRLRESSFSLWSNAYNSSALYHFVRSKSVLSYIKNNREFNKRIINKTKTKKNIRK